ncbi:unnamed protein product [Menidia menidia]|uniref:(Atlantic silverside) hypothetical protein n=1 Tax=Menidia menidia TaxID=238744 RepID=A0A8S4B8N0_9TELE|nr:unnamed protein product [Menidia menidia]
MVEQTRRANHVVSLQAGPGEVDTGTQFDLRIHDRAARAFGQQLAFIGDQMDREWTSREPNWPPAPMHLLRPAQILTRTIYRDIHSQFWGFQGLGAAVKAWIESTSPWHWTLRTESFTTWVSKVKPASCGGWTRGAVVTVALVAAGSHFVTLWMEA